MRKKIVVMTLIIVMGILAACGSSDEEQADPVDAEKENQEDSIKDQENVPNEIISDGTEEKVYEKGDMIEFTSGLKVTITDSGIYTESSLIDDEKVDAYAYLDVDVENAGDEDIPMVANIFDFYADGYALENVYLGKEGELPLTSDVSPGRKVKGRIYARGQDVVSAERIEAECGDAIIIIYENGDNGVGSDDIVGEDTGISYVNSYLGTLYSVYNGDDTVVLYMNDANNLCVSCGYGGEPGYSQIYDTYEIEDGSLYGYAGETVDEFVFEEDGLVMALLAGSGSEHYQTYIREHEYWETDWRKELGFE